MRAEYRLETLNYGEFTVQADARARNGDNYLNFGPLGQASQRSSGRITLRNLGFPITPHTFADTNGGGHVQRSHRRLASPLPPDSGQQHCAWHWHPRV